MQKCLRTGFSIFHVPLKPGSTVKASPGFTVTDVPPSGVMVSTPNPLVPGVKVTDARSKPALQPAGTAAPNVNVDAEQLTGRIDLKGVKGSQIEVTGLRVSRVDQAEPVFSAERVQVGGDWKAWQRGRLGAVRVESPSVYWRAGLR